MEFKKFTPTERMEAFEKATAKKPVKIVVENLTFTCCPNCGEEVCEPYCPNCGQKLNWSDNNGL